MPKCQAQLKTRIDALRDQPCRIATCASRPARSASGKTLDELGV